MDHDDDVERLFSWIKTPDLRYREFAAAREVADAVAAWPVLRKTASETQRPNVGTVPEPPVTAPERPPSARTPLGERLMSVFAHRPPAPRSEPEFREAENHPSIADTAGDVPWAPSAPPAPPPMFAHLETASPQPAPEPTPAPPPEVPRGAAPGGRDGLFGSTYRGFEDDDAVQPAVHPAVQPASPPDEGHPHSLEAIFSRLARPARGYREERRQAAGSSGLGPVFRRLR